LIGAVGLLIGAWVAGLGLTLVTGLEWDLEGRLAMGLALGCAELALLVWIFSIPGGMSAGSIAIALGCTLVTAIATLRTKRAAGRLRIELREAARRWTSLDCVPIAVTAGLTIAYLGWFFAHAIRMTSEGMFAGYESVYWDWPHHLGLTAYFSASHHLFPPANPWYSGINLNYSFLPDVLSGALNVVGGGVVGSVELTSGALSIATVVAFFSLVLHLTRSSWVSLLAVVLVFLGSGFGFVDFFRDVAINAAGGGSWPQEIGSLLSHPVRDYTFDQQTHWWFNPVLAYLIPQRNVLLGWPLGFLALRLMLAWWNGGTGRLLAGAGWVLGITPLFHANTTVALVLFAGGLALLGRARWRDWLQFAPPALLLGGALTLLLVPPSSVRSQFIRLQFEWMATSPAHPQSPVLFWFVQLGFFIPLAIAGHLMRRGWPQRVRVFLAPAWLLFLFANLLVLQPNAWDNSKTLIWWAMLVSAAAGVGLVRLWKRGAVGATLVAVILLFQSASGLIDLHRPLLAPSIADRQAMILDSDGVSLANWVRTSTPTDGVFLTSWETNDPIRVLGGRTQVLGGNVSLVGLGVDTAPRMEQVRAILLGGPDSARLMRALHVDYVVDDFPKYLTLNQAFYRSRYPVVYRSPNREYTVYRVS